MYTPRPLPLDKLNLTDEIVLVCAGGVVPHVAGVLVHEHAVHGGARVRLSRRPPGVLNLLQVMLCCPHPLPVPGDIVSAGPPSLGVFVCCK